MRHARLALASSAYAQPPHCSLEADNAIIWEREFVAVEAT